MINAFSIISVKILELFYRYEVILKLIFKCKPHGRNNTVQNTEEAKQNWRTNVTLLSLRLTIKLQQLYQFRIGERIDIKQYNRMHSSEIDSHKFSCCVFLKVRRKFNEHLSNKFSWNKWTPLQKL